VKEVHNQAREVGFELDFAGGQRASPHVCKVWQYG
jgi:hypothetical protein